MLAGAGPRARPGQGAGALLLPRVPLEPHPGGARHARLRLRGPCPAPGGLGPGLGASRGYYGYSSRIDVETFVFL